jgi:hypothetical protein
MSPEASMFDHRTEHGIPLAVGTLDELVLVASDLGITKDEAYRTLDLFEVAASGWSISPSKACPWSLHYRRKYRSK